MQNLKLTRTDGDHSAEVQEDESPFEILSYLSSGGTIKMTVPPRFEIETPEDYIDASSLIVWGRLYGMVKDGYMEMAEHRNKANGPFDRNIEYAFKITPAGEAFHGKLVDRAYGAGAWSGGW